MDSLGPTDSPDEAARTVLKENWDWESDWEYGWNIDGILMIDEVVPSAGEILVQVKGSMSANVVYGPS